MTATLIQALYFFNITCWLVFPFAAGSRIYLQVTKKGSASTRRFCNGVILVTLLFGLPQLIFLEFVYPSLHR